MDLHEAHVGNLGAEAGKDGFRARALQRKKGAIERLDPASLAKGRLQMREIGGLAGSVDHEQQVVAAVGGHQVVEDAARFVGEKGVALPALGKAEDVHGDQPLKGEGRVVDPARAGAQDDLAHVAHVEEAGGGAGVEVFLEDAGGIADRHVVAAKGAMRAPSETWRTWSGVLARSGMVSPSAGRPARRG
jgi:hypothetical protein